VDWKESPATVFYSATSFTVAKNAFVVEPRGYLFVFAGFSFIVVLRTWKRLTRKDVTARRLKGYVTGKMLLRLSRIASDNVATSDTSLAPGIWFLDLCRDRRYPLKALCAPSHPLRGELRERGGFLLLFTGELPVGARL
jgi:hypothetical protein